MPGMDGFETAARIKRRTRTKDIPIIFLTAVDRDTNSSYRGYAAGGADYISKPFDPWILRAKVQVFVDLWKAGRRLATQAALLRGNIGDGDGAVNVLGALRERLTGLEDAVLQLTAELHEADAPVAAAIDRVSRQLDSLGEALSGLEEGVGAAGVTRGEYG
jgi:response regulator RpfG family c-di-GMP phosphodiesterase